MKRVPLRQMPQVHEKKCVIKKAPAGRYVLFCENEMVAESDSPKWLSDSALVLSGATEVDWEPGIPWD